MAFTYSLVDIFKIVHY